MWAALAELAITMGTAGTAALLGSLVGDYVGKAAAQLSLESAEKLIKEGFGTAVEDAIKDSAAAAIKLGEVPEGPASAAETGHEGKGADPSGPRGLSENPRLAFFAQQQDMLSSVQNEQQDRMSDLRDRLVASMGEDSVPARMGLLSIKKAIDAVSGAAQQRQVEATTKEWVSYKARAKHGSEDAVDATGRSVNVTRMDDSKGDGESFPYAGQSSVLEITVVGSDVESVHAVGARMNGMSRNTVARFVDMDLGRAGIPIALLWGYRHITRDEAGRVRVGQQGAFASVPEVQAIEQAERVLAKVLGRSLKSWGVAEVATDDRKEEGV